MSSHLYWWNLRAHSKLHRFGVHWFKVNGLIPGRMCYICGKWVER